MAAPLSDTVSVTLTEDTVAVAVSGFGTPILLSYGASFSGVRSYGSFADVAADFGAGTPERIWAQRMFGQGGRAPKVVKIYAASFAPTQVAQLAVETVRNSHAYVVNTSGVGITTTAATFTSDASATAAEIHNGLLAALNGVAGNNYLATFRPISGVVDFNFTRSSGNILSSTAHGLQTGDGPVRLTNSGGGLPSGLATGTDYYAIRLTADTFSLASSLANALAGTAVTVSDAGTGTHTVDVTTSTVSPHLGLVVTGDSAGAFFSLGVNHNDLSLATTHADPGVEDDLDALMLVDTDWYVLHLPPQATSTNVALAASAWCEAQKRLFAIDAVCTLALTAAVGGAGNDITDRLHTLAYKYSASFVTTSHADQLAAAFSGLYLPTSPGQATVAFKRVAGVTPLSLTPTQRANLKAKCANWLEVQGGLNLLREGRVAVGGGTGWIDVTRDLDYLVSLIQAQVFSAIASPDRVGFDNEGIAVIEAALRAALETAVDAGIINRNFTVSIPLLEDIADAEKAARNLPDVKWSCQLRGAVHSVAINGTIRL